MPHSGILGICIGIYGFMGRLARSGRHFRNRPSRRPQHMTPYKRVIYPVDGFSSPCGYFIMQGIKTATRGAWRVLNGIQETSWTGAAAYLPAWALYLPHSGILRTQAGILSRKRKRRLYGRLARYEMPPFPYPLYNPLWPPLYHTL